MQQLVKEIMDTDMGSRDSLCHWRATHIHDTPCETLAGFYTRFFRVVLCTPVSVTVRASRASRRISLHTVGGLEIDVDALSADHRRRLASIVETSAGFATCSEGASDLILAHFSTDGADGAQLVSGSAVYSGEGLRTVLSTAPFYDAFALLSAFVDIELTSLSASPVCTFQLYRHAAENMVCVLLDFARQARRSTGAVDAPHARVLDAFRRVVADTIATWAPGEPRPGELRTRLRDAIDPA